MPPVHLQVPRLAIRAPTASCTFVQQETEFFDLDKSDYGLVPVQLDVWEGFIFVNLDTANTVPAARLPR